MTYLCVICGRLLHMPIVVLTIFSLYPLWFVFQYVGYARTYVNPKLTPAAANVLQVT